MKIPHLMTISKAISKNNVKNFWNVIKTVIRKSKICNDKFPKSSDINIEEITDKNAIAETFNKFYENAGSNLTNKTPPNS